MVVEESLVEVKLTYNTGKTVKLTEQSLGEWLANYIMGQQALARLQQMSQEGGQAETPDPPKIINLADAIARRNQETNESGS